MNLWLDGEYLGRCGVYGQNDTHDKWIFKYVNKCEIAFEMSVPFNVIKSFTSNGELYIRTK